MKRVFYSLLCVIVLFSFTACSSDTTALISGSYYAVGDYEKMLTPYLRLNTSENNFFFGPGSVVSYAENGTYVVVDGKIVATSQNTTFEFEIEDKKTLVLIDNGDVDGFKIPVTTKFVFSKDLK